MQSGMAARIAAADVDPLALQDTPVRHRRWRRPRTIFIVVGVIAYIVALIAFIPAKAVLDENERFKVGGTIWNGNAVLGGTLKIDWVVSPISSVSNLAFSTQVHVTGGGSDLTGQFSQSGDQLRIDDMAGQIGGDTLDVLFPRLPLRCRFQGDLRIEKLALGGSRQSAEGRVTTGPVTCFGKQMAGIPVEIAGLSGRIAPTVDNSSGSIATTDEGPVTLIEVRLSPKGALSVWPTQMAISRAPFLAGQRYDTIIE